MKNAGSNGKLQARKFGYVPRLMSDQEYINAENSRLHGENKRDDEERQECARPRPAQANSGGRSTGGRTIRPDEIEEAEDEWRRPPPPPSVSSQPAVRYFTIPARREPPPPPPSASHTGYRYYALPPSREPPPEWDQREYAPDLRSRDARHAVPERPRRRSLDEDSRSRSYGDLRRRWSEESVLAPEDRQRAGSHGRGRSRKGS
jgi:hypothetical protein